MQSCVLYESACVVLQCTGSSGGLHWSFHRLRLVCLALQVCQAMTMQTMHVLGFMKVRVISEYVWYASLPGNAAGGLGQHMDSRIRGWGQHSSTAGTDGSVLIEDCLP